MFRRINQIRSQGSRHKYENGATALFVVIFAAILLSLITVSFTTLMIREQGRSSDDEQSQGAYDAALAGVEDGKRVLAECLANSGPSGVQACAAIDADQCDTVARAGIAGSIGDPEVMVQSSSAAGSGDELNLAYTCVTIQQNTEFYRRTLATHDESVIVQLRATDEFDTVTIEWHTEEDAAASVPSATTDRELFPLSSWPPNYPPIIRAQLMQFPSGDMDAAGLFNASPYALTKYLYPKTVGSTAASFSTDPRRIASSSIIDLAQCQVGFDPATGYSCKIDLELPEGGSVTKANRVAYLRLTTIYSNTRIRLSLSDSAVPANNVFFENVQPAIDSTGRANDLFRRVSASVEVTDTEFPFPRATVDITNNFCKNLFVTDESSDYRDGVTTGDCNPAGP